MKTETKMTISALVFAALSVAFVALSAYDGVLSLSLFFAMFIAYWFGRIWERTTHNNTGENDG